MTPSRAISKSGFEKFEILDEAISQFRKFATEKLVNLIVVIHPKKEDDNQALGISSIFGTAKATQEADIVLILQRLVINPTPQTPSSHAYTLHTTRYSLSFFLFLSSFSLYIST